MNVISLPTTDPVLTRKEGAALLKVSQPTFDLLYHGDSPRLKAVWVGKQPRFRTSDIMALFDREGT